MSRRLTTRILIALAMLIPASALIAAPASAHRAQAPHISCAELDGTFTDFPAGPNTVVMHTTRDGVPLPDVAITGQGPNFVTSVGYYNPDAAPHTISVYFTWTADGGGRSSTTTGVITNCPTPASQEDIRNLQIQINEQHNQIVNLTNYATFLDQRITKIENSVKALSCKSQRIYEFLVRREIEGSPVVAIGTVLVRNQAEFGSVRAVMRDGVRRFQVVADYRNLVVPKGQVRTVVVPVTTANGRQYRTTQKLRICMGPDGNMQDTSSQDRNRL